VTDADEAVETEEATWRVTADADRRRRYTRTDDNRQTDVTVHSRAFDSPTVDVAGPHDPGDLLDTVGVDEEEATVRRWDRVESGDGTWFALRDGTRRMFRYTAGRGGSTTGVVTHGEDGDTDRLSVSGPDLRPVLDAFDEVRADYWHVTGADDPGARVAETAGRAARVEWSTDHPGVDATMTFDADGRATGAAFEGPDPGAVDPEAAGRANIGPLSHVDEVDDETAARLAPVVDDVDWTDDSEAVARSTAYLRTGRRGEADLLRSVDDVRKLLPDETVRASPDLAAAFEQVREESVETLAGSERLRAAMSEEARTAADQTVTTDVVAAGPNLDGLLDEAGPDRADVYLAWHAGDDPAERAAVATAAAADVVAWPEDAAEGRSVRGDDGERRRVTRCATTDDSQSYVVHVDEFGTETHGHADHEAGFARVSGENPEPVAAALDTDPAVVTRGVAAGPLLDAVRSAGEASLVDRLDTGGEPTDPADRTAVEGETRD